MAMDFSSAFQLLKGGRWIAREGWNGKGMYLYLDEHPCGPDGTAYEPCIVMFTAQRQHQPGWLASQADLLADDWMEVPIPASSEFTVEYDSP